MMQMSPADWANLRSKAAARHEARNRYAPLLGTTPLVITYGDPEFPSGLVQKRLLDDINYTTADFENTLFDIKRLVRLA
jgi:hypothetical protein